MNNYDEAWDRPSDDWDYAEAGETPEFAVGQIWRVTGDFLHKDKAVVGDILRIIDVTTTFCGDEAEALFPRTMSLVRLFDHERNNRCLEYVAQGPVKSSDGVPPAYTTSVPEAAESVSQAITGYSEECFKDKSDDLPGAFMWKIIDGSKDYNGHKQLEISQMSLAELKLVVRTLEQYLEHDEDTLATCLEIRLMYNGDPFGNWGASVYQVNYWKEQEHSLGHRDRLLFTVGDVMGN